MSYTSRKVYEFISKQTNPATDGAGDPIVERKTCRISGTQFPIFQSDLAFYKKASPTIAGKIYAIPLPTICPEERERRRLAFRNERKLYKRTCDATNKDVISLYSPANPYTVYDQKYRQSDAWDPLQYGVPYESTVSMQKMFVRLHESFPRISLNTHLNENSEYTNQVRHSKDCYMCFDSGYLEDSLYCSSCFYSSKCLECYMCKQCTDCFQCVQCIDCYASLYSYKCKNCTNALQSSNCENCSHIFQCENLQHQSYCILNKQVTKEEFEIYVAQHMTTLLERPHASIKEHMEQQ
ncbi:MAG: hypothetical protein Q8O99_06095 [bacterium]|nr:hypothetical protein [bacterium]